jgi:hypothetical protein
MLFPTGTVWKLPSSALRRDWHDTFQWILQKTMDVLYYRFRWSQLYFTLSSFPCCIRPLLDPTLRHTIVLLAGPSTQYTASMVGQPLPPILPNNQTNSKNRNNNTMTNTKSPTTNGVGSKNSSNSNSGLNQYIYPWRIYTTWNNCAGRPLHHQHHLRERERYYIYIF